MGVLRHLLVLRCTVFSPSWSRLGLAITVLVLCLQTSSRHLAIDRCISGKSIHCHFKLIHIQQFHHVNRGAFYNKCLEQLSNSVLKRALVSLRPKFATSQFCLHFCLRLCCLSLICSNSKHLLLGTRNCNNVTADFCPLFF